MKSYLFIISGLIVFLMSGCAAYFNQPTHTQEARFGEETNSFEYLQNLRPQVPIVVGVYKFKDQTGQYKQVDAGVSYSTAVTQGATTILIKALEDSKWFIPIERENISNLLNERQIIRATRQEENQKNNSNVEPDLPPLLFAGVLLEGGIVSYDTNIITGGSGLRYFGAGGSNQYREDRITIYLRAVSTSTGKILKTVYISKTILSQAIDINLYRYVKTRRLLEIETGVSQNEPVQLAVKDAIDKAVESLVIEGLKDNLWQAQEGIEAINEVFIAYEKEKDEAGETALFNRRLLNYRGKTSLAVAPYGTFFDGDYDNSRIDIGGEVIYKYYAGKPNINISMAAGLLTLSNTNVFKNDFISLSTNLEYTILPYDKVSPFLYAGVGGLSDIGFNDFYFKTQYGGGLEFIPIKNLGFRIFAEQNILFNDELDNMIQGKQNDYYWKFGAGINIYLSEF